MRLIDADVLKATISKYEFNSPNERYKQGGECVLNFYMPKIIDDAPTVDAVPVRHGRWIRSGGNKYPIYTCFECKYPSSEKTNFCPNCGARMDGGKNINN